MDKWDKHFLKQAQLASEMSKDPSTKCGGVIVRPNKSVVSTGYNGFPRGMEDSAERYENREEKLSRVVHCEMNAILQAHQSVEGCTLYVWPFLTCDRCAVHVIQAGITRVVAPVMDTSTPESAARAERWKDSFIKTQGFYEECGVAVTEYELEEIFDE